MDDFESELNIVHKILKNDETFTNLIITTEHQIHYINYKSKYTLIYRNCGFINILIDSLHNNTYINELCVKKIFSHKNGFIEKIIKMKNWKSIYINGLSLDVLHVLSTQQNPQLEKLQLSQISMAYNEFLKTIKNSPSLVHFKLDICGSTKTDLRGIANTIQRSNVKSFIIKNAFDPYTDIDFIANIIKCKIINLHLINSRNMIKFDLTNNYTILNFTVNKICPDYTHNILNRNKKYIFTILLCMNKKIIPRCIFKNLILSKII